MGRLTTPLCRSLGIDVPVIQAPIGAAAVPELAAAVAEAGGLGMLALTWRSADDAVRRVRRVRQLTGRPFAVNFVLDFPIVEQLAACLDEGVALVATSWGDPGRVHGRIHSAGALHLHMVGSAREAREAVDAGVDVVVAQGWEAGGHVLGQVTTMVLVPAVVDAVDPVPVVAAGGIADGRGLAAVLALGAQAGWIGTRFLAAAETSIHRVHRDRVIEAAADDAVYTRCFEDGWPRAAQRVIRNATLSAWEAAGSPPHPDRPGEGEVVATDASGHNRVRYGFGMPLAGMTGDVESMALYAGQAVGLVHNVIPAAAIVAALEAGAVEVVETLSRAVATTA